MLVAARCARVRGGGVQDGDGVVESSDGDVVAVGPSLPRVEGGRGPLEVGESTSDGVELGGQVVVTDVGASLVDVGERGAVALDVRGGLLLGSCEGRSGPIENASVMSRSRLRLVLDAGAPGEATLRRGALGGPCRLVSCRWRAVELLWEQEVAGSNPASPTDLDQLRARFRRRAVAVVGSGTVGS